MISIWIALAIAFLAFGLGLFVGGAAEGGKRYDLETENLLLKETLLKARNIANLPFTG
jgi:hypothetical protein